MITYTAAVTPHINVNSHDYETALMRMIELTLSNPPTGTAEETELHMLSERTRRYESALFPVRTHPHTGDVCPCQIECAGAACSCWCHTTQEVSHEQAL